MSFLIDSGGSSTFRLEEFDVSIEHCIYGRRKEYNRGIISK